jgi:N6-adenosine-specific RNA methylase IME4
MNAASVCRAFETSRRREVLPFTHHAEVAGLAIAEQDRLLDDAARYAEENGIPQPSRMLRQEAKRQRRDEREQELAEETERASVALGSRLYSLIYADPPWRFEPRSRVTGMDRAADNHYPTMDTNRICDLAVPAAKNAVLFLWRTAPMAREAYQVMDAWGFEYRSEFIWVKPREGTGYWNRNRHEVLMLGVKGAAPAPAPGQQWESVIEAPAGRHSEKPAVFRELIDLMFPRQIGLEMFARGSYAGWDRWGNQTEG